MTDIDKLPAGAALNAAVAERVMGWPRYKEGDANWGRRPYVAEFADGSTNIYTTQSNYWCPSTDIAAAWEVLNELRRRRIFLAIWSAPDGWDVEDYETAADWAKDAPTGPLAICRAALKAVEVKG